MGAPSHPAHFEHRHADGRFNYSIVRVADFEAGVTFSPVADLGDDENKAGVAETGLAARLPRECLDCDITTPGLVVNATAPLPMAVLLLARAPRSNRAHGSTDAS